KRDWSSDVCSSDLEEVADVPLTPLDIHNKEFSRSFRGYDEDEVNEFLDQVIKDYEMVIREKKELEEQVEQLKEKLGHFTNIEETLNKSILVYFSSAGDSRRSERKCHKRVEIDYKRSREKCRPNYQ